MKIQISNFKFQTNHKFQNLNNKRFEFYVLEF